jgi:hypothetical protein
MRALRLALGLAFALAGCTPDGLATDPRATLDPGSSGSTGFTTGHTGGSLSSATVGGSSGGPTTGSGSTGGSSAGSTGSSSSGGSGSGGTTGNCPQTGPAPTLQCQRSDGSTRWLMTKESVHLDCTLTGAEETPTWSGSVAPGFFSVDVRNAPAVITVGLGEATLPTTFGDTQVQVTLTATFCQAAPAQTTVSLPVVGNNLITDHYGGRVELFSSGGTDLGHFAGAVFNGSVAPSLIASLSNGHLLIGGQGLLAEVDRTGALVRTFDAVDGAGNDLYPGCPSGSGCTVDPVSAAEASDGKLWVSVNQGQSRNGFLYRFLPSGAYFDTVPAPAAAAGTTYWLPYGVARRSDGAMLVATGDVHDPPHLAVYPAGSTAGSYVAIDMKECDTSGCSEPTFAEQGLAGLWIDPDDTVFLGNLWADGIASGFGAFDGASLSFLRGTQHPASNDSVANSYGNRALTRSGDMLLAATWTGCVWALDPQTLYPLPQGPGVGSFGCVVSTSVAIDPRGVAHLGPAP